jgi:hypothetical protein
MLHLQRQHAIVASMLKLSPSGQAFAAAIALAAGGFGGMLLGPWGVLLLIPAVAAVLLILR